LTSHEGRRFPILIGSQDIYEGRVINLRVDTIEVANGTNVRREVVEHPGAVVIVAIDEQGRLLWERQYRYPIDKELFELPAGTLEQGEDPALCASRELAEETGFRPGKLESLGAFYTAPGFCTEYMHAFQASDLQPATDSHLDDDEEIEVVRLSLEESLGRLDSGQVQDAKSIAALFLYLRKRLSL
jgi:ADP-ribose pyrophosphatase